LLKVIVCSTF
jgi:translation initiation factor 1A